MVEVGRCRGSSQGHELLLHGHVTPGTHPPPQARERASWGGRTSKVKTEIGNLICENTGWYFRYFDSLFVQ